MAVWNRESSQSVLVESADLTASGPVLAGLRIPARAFVGVAAVFSVTPRAWGAQPRGAPVWRFGDGKSATGTRVTHAYQSTSKFTVSVSQDDAAGGRSTATGKVSVTPR